MKILNANVSVVIPTRNRDQTLALALDSLQRQTARDWDCWVIDDHSCDGTKALVAGYLQSDSRFHYADLPARAHGANAARNLGMRLSSGRYLVFLDSDDALQNDCLQERIAHMAAHPQLDFSVRGTWLFEKQPGDRDLLWNVPSGIPALHRFLTLDIPWQTAGVIWKRESLDSLGGWNESLLSWQDWELHVRAIAAGLRYDQSSAADCYWRLPRSDSLWKLSYETAHFRQKGPLFGRVQRSLRRVWTDELSQLLAGLYFWHACLWREHGGTVYQATRLWALAWFRGLIPHRYFFAGHRLFSLEGPDRNEMLGEIRSTWPKGYLRADTSTTFQKVRATLPS